MAMTIPALGKALEDLTRAYNLDTAKIAELKDKCEQELKSFDQRLTAQRAVFILDALLGEGNISNKTDITPTSLKPFEKAIEADENNAENFTEVLLENSIFAPSIYGEYFSVAVKFIQTKTIPNGEIGAKVSIELMAEAEILVAKIINIGFESIDPATGAFNIDFSFKKPDKEIKSIRLYAGEKGKTQNVACKYKDLLIYKVTPYTQTEIERVESVIKNIALETKKFYNVIRNENGTIIVPEPKQDNEASNMKFVKDEIKNKISELIDNAPEELDTLKELADALNQNKNGIQAINTALTNRYTKEEVDALLENLDNQKVTQDIFNFTEIQNGEPLFFSKPVKVNKIWNGKEVYRAGCVFTSTDKNLNFYVRIEDLTNASKEYLTKEDMDIINLDGRVESFSYKSHYQLNKAFSDSAPYTVDNSTNTDVWCFRLNRNDYSNVKVHLWIEFVMNT